MKPVFKSGYFTKSPVARTLKGFHLSRTGLIIAIGQYAFGCTW